MKKKIIHPSLKNKMPLLFIGHGSPMNAIETNTYTQTLTAIGQYLTKPKAILVISAHWITKGTWVTEMMNPKTIHDFYGFPKALFEVQYPAPGSLHFSSLIKKLSFNPQIQGDQNQWGLDHGTWTILRHMYPDATIPVLQLSLDLSQPPDYHINLGKQLSELRRHGVLIIGSGNLIHNLHQIRWEPNAKPYDWAIEFNDWIKEKLIMRDFNSVLKDFHKMTVGKLSIPTFDHYYPLHYILGASDKHDELYFEYDEIQNGSVSMLSIRLG